MKKHKEILSRFGINKTQFRIDLLSLFFDCKSSLKIHEIFERFNKKTNKVTIYRALKSFEQKGLIHQVPDKNNLKKYSLCNLDSCSPDSHNHQHGHFICYSCDQTFCLISKLISCLTFVKSSQLGLFTKYTISISNELAPEQKINY